ncbi:MAG TPA: hypothetical protein VKR22_00860 [Acidimicrobiales bacterium]|nr:hypothetical protein [Acidimicrobiales bacterium]
MDPTADPIAPSAAPFSPPVPSAPDTWSTPGTADESGRTVAQPGTLGIRERRAWRTWQLAGAAVLTFVFGLYIESLSHAKAGTSASPSTPAYKLPTPTTVAGGASRSGTTVPVTGAGGGGTGGGSTTTTAAPTSGPTTTVAATGTAIVLVPRYQATGNWTSNSFTVTGGTWNIGWAYQCTPPPASGPGFQVSVSPGGSTAVTESNASGQGVTPVTSTGAQTISVQAAPGCVWVVKATGIGTP